MSSGTTKGRLDLLLLAVLRHGEMHGYAVIEALKSQSAGVFDLPEGTVYPALHRLERGKLVESFWDRGSGRRRRCYRITERGLAALESERAAWRNFADAVALVVEP